MDSAAIYPPDAVVPGEGTKDAFSIWILSEDKLSIEKPPIKRTVKIKLV